ncbi:methyltransferase domain-containing protein [Amycolatopsis sp. NPDC023774]|uniref:class I SAM-dependent DNA methyltransferase n=1 Tax=Amycolatopsis sp. NPDC023774 TaxID=3155015 RepID=UPI0033E314CB
MADADFVVQTRDSYDTLASDYGAWLYDELAAKPLDRALLNGFAELVQSANAGPVADLGCGTGRVTDYLRRLGLSVFGVDLSPQMIEVARQMYPDSRFDVGAMTELDVDNGSLSGIVAWYSIIHIPTEHLPEVFAEFNRVLAPGGYVQLAFQAGEGVLHRSQAGGHPVSLDFHQRQPDQVINLLHSAGLIARVQVLREPDEDGKFKEDTPQAFVLARKRAPLKS